MDSYMQDSLLNAYVADLGLSISISNRAKHGVFGILPYIAPEVLNGKQFTTKSDIYSFSIIMWEILYGTTVSYIHKLNEIDLQLQICDSLRPPVNKEAPRCYVNLMKECWDKDPEKRPSAGKLCEIFKKWQDNEDIYLS
ncbi:kinase-like domain-containing protein [Gigaspora rosea]|uniref:Kinase-like domain-containing protein n=1 Tax=Gigaspora rosea TaxID=44941 RepID=A0A397VU56_9GLOM|nr:kinase-like domain-containing protein [Gigaspora rosea]